VKLPNHRAPRGTVIRVGRPKVIDALVMVISRVIMNPGWIHVAPQYRVYA